MSRASFALSDELAAYVAAHSDPLDEIGEALVARTASLPAAGMQVAPQQAAFLRMLVTVTGARRVLEVGTFTGLSALEMARGLPPDGILVACDVSEEWTSIGRSAWEAAGVADRIDLRIAPAAETLSRLRHEGARFDLAFVDADKQSYVAYLEAAADLLVSGGLLLVDNTLWSGSVVDPRDPADAEREGILGFNDAALADERFDTVLLPVFDGLTMMRRR